jgi:hypothetical protein
MTLAKAGAFSPALLVPVATTETNEPYKPGLMAFFYQCPVVSLDVSMRDLFDRGRISACFF